VRQVDADRWTPLGEALVREVAREDVVKAEAVGRTMRVARVRKLER
jgi:hypothetical protein